MADIIVSFKLSESELRTTDAVWRADCNYRSRSEYLRDAVTKSNSEQLKCRQ